MKKSQIQKSLISLGLILTMSTPALAHSGRTDSNGGHRDNKNVSGLGSYHYHHGQGPHLHPGGVCPLNGSSTTSKNNSSSSSSSSSANKQVTVDTTAQDKATAKQAGYNAGYKDGYNGSFNSPNSSSSKYPSEFEAGYKDGYNKGNSKLTSEREAISNKAKTNGYNDGLNGKENNSSSYSGSHSTEYKTAYDLGYSEGNQKREKKINAVKNKAKSLGEKDGYNQVDKNKHQYSGEYSSEYMKSYLEGYSLGEKKIQDDTLKLSREAYLLALEGKKFDSNIYKTDSIKTKCEDAYKKGEEFRNKYLNVGSLLGQPLENFENHIKDTENIHLGLDIQNDNSFIAIDNSNTKKVRQINIYASKIIEDGFNKEQAELFLNNFFTSNVLEQYKHTQSFENKKDSNIKVYRLKMDKRVDKSLPKNLYISIKSENNLISEINISYKKPSALKKL